jgi:hypothetical protein
MMCSDEPRERGEPGEGRATTLMRQKLLLISPLSLSLYLFFLIILSSQHVFFFIFLSSALCSFFFLSLRYSIYSSLSKISLRDGEQICRGAGTETAERASQRGKKREREDTRRDFRCFFFFFFNSTRSLFLLVREPN